MTMRLVRAGTAAAAAAVARRMVTPEQRHRLLVQMTRELTSGLSHDHIAYMVAHRVSLFEILPGVLQSALFAWICRDYLGVLGATNEDTIAAVIEARPDLADLVALTAGRAWLMDMVSGRDLGL